MWSHLDGKASAAIANPDLQMRSDVPSAPWPAGPAVFQVPALSGEGEVMGAKKKVAKRTTSARGARRTPGVRTAGPTSPEGNVVLICADRCGYQKRIQVPEGAAVSPFVAQHIGPQCPDCGAGLITRSAS